MRRNIIIIISIFIFLFVVLAVYFLSPWYGKVVDKNTGQPIEGAVLVRSWDVETASPAGTVTSFFGMKETLTDKNGKFIIFKKLYFPGIPILIWISENRPIIFKPGYKFLILDNKTSTISLERIPTIIEIREKELWDARGNYEVDLYKTKLFLKIIEREREFIESPETSRSFFKDLEQRKKYVPYYPIDSYGIPPSGTPPSIFTKATSPTSDKYNRGIVQAGSGVVQTGIVNLEKQEMPMSKSKTVESLINTYKDKNTSVESRRVTVLYLGQTKDPKAIPILIDALKDEEVQVRLMAVSALSNFQDQRVLEALLIALRDKDERVRFRAASVLGNFQDLRVIEALIDALKDEEFRVRLNAVSSLGNFQDRRAIEGLIIALKDNDIRIRLNAVSRLGESQDQRAVEGLIIAFRDKYPSIRSKSIESLSKIGKPAVEPLIKDLENKETRIFAAKALGEIKDPRAITPLINLLNLNENGISSTAALALGNFKDKKAIDALVKALKEYKNLRYKLRAALINIGPPSVEYLIPLLNDKDYLVRIEVIKIFGQIKDIRTVKALIKAWDDEDFDVRVKASESLVEIGTPSVEPLISLLKDEDSYFRWRAAWCLGMIKEPKSVKPLSESLNDKITEVQWIVIDALGKIGGKGISEHLVTFCKNEDVGLRKKAESTIIKLGGQNICKKN